MTNIATLRAVTPLNPLFAAEITGIDLTVPMSSEAFRVIWDAFNEHQVLVFRDQRLDDASQIAFSRRFGALEMMEAHPANDFNPSHISVMTNLDAEGNILPLTHPMMIHRLRNEHWHSDSSFKAIGALCSLLSAREVPPAGGNTEFASARVAYAALPEDRRRELEGLRAVHRVTAPDQPDEDAYDQEQKRRLTVTHPVVRVNPVNRRRNLYVGAHAQEIVGMAGDAGRALLDELTAFCTQPQFVYSHAWRQHDLVIWDNRCTLHRATTFDKARYRRKLHRTTVAGREPESALATMPEAEAAHA